MSGASETLKIQGEKDVAALRLLHGEINFVGLEFRGQSEAESEERIAVAGRTEPCDFRILRRRGLLWSVFGCGGGLSLESCCENPEKDYQQYYAGREVAAA